MPNFTVEQISECMKSKKNVRNMSVISHIDHGKCVNPCTPLFLENGKKVLAKNLKLGDKLLGDNNNFVTIQSIHKGRGKMYEITQNCGNSFRVNGNHILCLKATNLDGIHWYQNKGHYKVRWLEKFSIQEKFFPIKKKKMISRCTYYDDKDAALKACEQFLKDQKLNNKNYVGYKTVVEISVKDFIELPKHVRSCFKLYKVPFNFKKQKVDLDPYMLGLWLGDGTETRTDITTVDREIVEYCESFV